MKKALIRIPDTPRTLFRHSAIALALVALGTSAQARGLFEKPDADFRGRVSVMEAVHPGSTVTVNGRNFKPGQEVQLLSNGQPITADRTIEVDDKGEFKARVTVPKNTATGMHPVVVQVAKPAAASVFNFKVSPVIPLSGADQFTVTSEKLNPGLYQVAYSPKNEALFVTAAVGRPPVKESSLMKVDAGSLKIGASITPAADPANDKGQLHAVYGVAVDDDAGHVWVTNTRGNTVAVYKQADLSLVKQFPNGVAAHARDVVIDEKRDRAYTSSPGHATVGIFDTEKLAHVADIELKAAKRTREIPSPMSLALDSANGKLYTVSATTNEAFVIDLDKQAVERVIDLPGALDASGVAVAADEQLLFVASQDSDNLLIIDLKDGSVKHNVPVGANALNVLWEPVKKLAWVASRASGTLAVVNAEGRLLANLEAGTFPNHITTDGKGNVFVVNKAKGKDDKTGDRVSRYTMK